MITAEDQAALGVEARRVEGEHIPASEAPTEEQAPLRTGVLISQLLRPTFRVLAPAWNIADAECDLLGESYGAVVDKYFPDLDLGVELAAVLATFAVFGPRWGTPRAAVKPPKPDKENGG